jgi:hypothetical protein
MILASVFDQILGTLCTGFFTVILVISVAGVLGGRFLKRNEEARKVAKRVARAAALKAARRWLK